ncbi:hypothetical protein CBA19CS11_09620 [Caballeronia novacaledonica]|jgi:hypothetical protein|uniref:hypothetical protein n=1 Tax=Caballeronia novacaledonica TaxID=1544861 RepID=UPI001EE1EA2B|nr:hypothetical protein [Caballeronia novacaledonica]GJH09084.1 hypothetical protein CBA19CS11_09620 [Caballeronia novacaledonica]
MTTLPVPRGHLAVESDIRENDDGRRRASAGVVRWQFGRAHQSDHAEAFDMNARGVPTDSAAVVSVGACTGAGVRARVGLLAAQARG